MSDLFSKLQQSIKDNIPKGLDDKVGALGAAGVGGLLGALFGGTQSVQNAVRNVAVIGGGAALGSMAYKLFQKWTGSGTATAQQPAQANSSIFTSDDPFAEYNAQHSQVVVLDTKEASRLLLEAMIFAARADGHIDQNEQKMIMTTAKTLCADDDFNQVIRESLAKPLDPQSLADKVKNADQAMDVYRFSAVAIDVDHPLEQQYLDKLAQALKLSPETKAQLDQEALAVKQSQAQA